MTGRVISIKSNKTATVLVERIATHPLYKKTFIRSKKYLVDDAIGVKLGDIVDIVNCKPISKNKSWKITKVLGKSLAEIAEETLKKDAEEIIAEVMPEEKEGEGQSVKGEEIKTQDDAIQKEVKTNKGQSRKEKKLKKKSK